MNTCHRRLRVRHLTVSVILGLGLFAGSAGAPSAAAERDLFGDLGGHEGIATIVETFLFRLADDERIAGHFLHTNIERFYEKLVEHVCVLADGPCEYTGDTMERVHKGMNIDDADFNALVEVFIESMEAVDIPTGAQNRLLARMARLYPKITYR